MIQPDAARATTFVGLVSVVVGAALIVAPSRTATIMGLGDHPGVARTIGAADLALGPGLLRGRPRWPWMWARAALNILIAAQYCAEARHSSSPRARAGAATMAALAVADSTVALALRRAEDGERRPSGAHPECG